MVGLVRSVHGLAGEVRVEILTDRPDERFGIGQVVFREGRPDSLTVVRADPIADGPGWWMRFAEVPDRTTAERLRGAYLEAVVATDDRPGDAAWWHEVIGVDVTASDGRPMGRVVDVYRAGGAEVYVVEGPTGRLDIPAVAAFVVEFEPLAGRIVVDPEALGLDEADPG